MSVDRRIHPRVLVAIEAQIGLESEQQVQTMENLSLGGCFVRTSTPEPVGTVVTVSFPLPGDTDARSMRATGSVAWIRTEPGSTVPYGMGIRFNSVEDTDIDVLAGYITGAIHA